MMDCKTFIIRWLNWRKCCLEILDFYSIISEFHRSWKVKEKKIKIPFEATLSNVTEFICQSNVGLWISKTSWISHFNLKSSQTVLQIHSFMIRMNFANFLTFKYSILCISVNVYKQFLSNLCIFYLFTFSQINYPLTLKAYLFARMDKLST